MSPSAARVIAVLLVLGSFAACRERAPDLADSMRSEPAPAPPVNATNWNLEAGPVMVVALEGDSVAIVLPQATDSSMPFQESPALQSSLSVDLVGRVGAVGAAAVTPITRTAGAAECRSWPAGRIKPRRAGWRVGFPAGRVAAVPLDSIEEMSSVDSAALARSIARNVAALALESDSDFRGLPFRVRSAHTFRADSIHGVIADVVRSVNEEANPRLEHLFVIGERPAGSSAGYNVAFFSRTAGAEDDAEITELLAVVLIGPKRVPTAVVNVEYDEGGKLGLIERTAAGEWEFRWRSAYAGC
jgi:hypothetical protein